MLGPKLKNLRIGFFFDKVGELIQHNFAENIWRKIHKVGSHSFCSCTMSSSQVISNTMLYFYHLSNMILGSYVRE